MYSNIMSDLNQMHGNVIVWNIFNKYWLHLWNHLKSADDGIFSRYICGIIYGIIVTIYAHMWVDVGIFLGNIYGIIQQFYIY